MSMRRAATAAALGLGMLGSASACPVCFDAADPTVLHFYSISTMFLSFVPFVLMGGVATAAWHLRRQSTRQ